MRTTIENLIEMSGVLVGNSFESDFIEIIANGAISYESPGDTPMDALKCYFEDLQRGGCASGMVGSFIYNNDCKAFYIEHIDSLEDFRRELEGNLGGPIQNRNKLPHYTFMCWLCFEEFCYRLYNAIYE